MADALNFRSAFNGFNREDVVHYIEYLNSNHENQIKQLQADLAAAQKEMLLPKTPAQDATVASLQEQCAQQEVVLAAVNAEKDELIGRCAQLEATVATLSAQNKDLLARCTQLESALAAANAERDAAVVAKPQMSAYAEEELAAYRRAERVEREATERANAIYYKLQGLLSDTTSKTNAAVNNLDGIADQVNTQLAMLRDSLLSSKMYMEQTAASVRDIRPNQNVE